LFAIREATRYKQNLHILSWPWASNHVVKHLVLLSELHNQLYITVPKQNCIESLCFVKPFLDRASGRVLAISGSSDHLPLDACQVILARIILNLS
jgi:hypothetical protein